MTKGRRLVLVEWLDSRQPAPQWQWTSSLEPALPIKCLSVGFLLRQDRYAVALAPNLGDIDSTGDQQVSGCMTIPRRAVTRIRTLASPN